MKNGDHFLCYSTNCPSDCSGKVNANTLLKPALPNLKNTIENVGVRKVKYKKHDSQLCSMDEFMQDIVSITPFVPVAMGLGLFAYAYGTGGFNTIVFSFDTGTFEQKGVGGDGDTVLYDSTLRYMSDAPIHELYLRMCKVVMVFNVISKVTWWTWAALTCYGVYRVSRWVFLS
jgi:hypothetical protein